MRCEVCTREVVEDELVNVGNRSVCVLCKPLAIQEIKEGVDTGDAAPIAFGGSMFAYGHFLQLSWNLWRKDWLAMVSLAALASLPSCLALILVEFQLVKDPESLLFKRQLVSFFEAVLYFSANVFVALGVAKLVDARAGGRPTDLVSAMAHARRRWLAGVGTSLLARLIMGILLLLLIVPGLIWWVNSCFCNAVVSLRAMSGTAAFDYSKWLVTGNWWAVAGRFAIVTLIPSAAIFGIQQALEFFEFSPGLTIGSYFLANLCRTFSTAAVVVLFLNMDAIRGPVRKSGRLRVGEE